MVSGLDFKTAPLGVFLCIVDKKAAKKVEHFQQSIYLWVGYSVICLMLPFLNKKKNDEPVQSPEDKKRPLDELENDITVLKNEEMLKIEGGKTEPITFSDVLGWSSSLGGTIKQ